MNKLSLPLTIIIGSIILGGFYYATQVGKQKSIEKQQEVELQQKNQERFDRELIVAKKQQDLQICLEQSEYQVESSHLWLCSSLGRTNKSCGDVFGSSKDIFQSLASYKRIYGETKTVEDFDAFSEKCNCGLEKYKRDEIQTEKTERDNVCLQLYK